MKITTILYLISFLPISASIYSQNLTLNLKVENKTIKEVLDQIEKDSQIHFFYNDKFVDLGKKVNIEVTKMSISNILDKLFLGTTSSFKILNNNFVVIAPKVIIQQQKLSGTITDAITGDAIIGANIVIEGTTIGVVSDIKGKYVLDIPKGDAVIIVSFLGYNSERFSLNGQSVIDIKLVPDVKALGEVVVIGYGTVKKSDMTGSVSSIKSNELKLLPTQRADQALQGRSAGVMVTNTDGAPGGNTSIRIRGMNSIQGGNNALIVIDGLQGANLNTIDPNDIESMEILKDASATAIYGSRGSNGVILITTKGGKKGKPSINYNGSFGFQTLAKKLDVLNAYDYATLVNENRMRDDLHSPIPIFSESQLADFKSGPSTNWQDEIYRVAKMQNHQLSMDGGTDKTTYYFSAGALLQDGILLNSGYKRYNIRGNINSQINDWIKAGLNVSVINTSGTVSPFGGQSNASFLSSAIILAPQWPATIPVRDAQGNYSIAPINNGPVGSWNPVASAMETSTLNYQIDNNANTYLEFSLLKGLKLKVTGSGNVITNNNRTYWDSKTYEGIPVGGLSGKGFVNQSRFEQYQNSNILTYDNEFGKHHLTFTGVVEEQTQSGTGNRIEAEQFAFDPNGLNDLSGAKIVRIATTSAYKRFLLSFLGRVNYTFAGKYLFTASMRRDGSSVFGSDHKWGNFPSVALGWKLSEESFIKSLSVISDLKLRASWGKTGNQGISPYQTLASIYSNPGGLNYPYDGTDNTTSIGYALSGPANPKLKWETTTQTNIGLDFGFFNNRLTGNIDLFNKVTTDLLMYRSLPGYTGFYGIIDNVGSVGNKGIELTLGGDPLSGAVQWHTGISVSLMKNEILDIGTDKEILSQSSGGGYGTGYMAYLKKGGSFGSWYGYKYLGTWKENERTQAAEFGKLPGDAKYQDTNGDGKVDIDDRVLIGNALPNVIYGWSNTVVYKDFAMSVLIQGVSGNNVFNTPRIRLEAPGSGTSTALLDKYSSTNQGSDIPAFQKASSYLPLSSAGKTDKYFIDALYTGATSRWVENGSYLRVKNITLAYNIPSNLTYKYGIKRSKIYVSGTNLFTLTKYKGYDPEVSSFNDSDGSIGIDFGNYPAPKTFTFGMELSF